MFLQRRAVMNKLSIRSYTKILTSHSHDHHQLVLPLHGFINIQVAEQETTAGYGDCVIIPKHHNHAFQAHETARFIVADLAILPDNILSYSSMIFSINPEMLAYILFLEKQFSNQIQQEVEDACFHLFHNLLARQTVMRRIDPRIQTIIQFIKQHLDRKLPLKQLADISCLSTSQFKSLFKKSTGMSSQAYITQLKMEKASALLRHSDLPVYRVAEAVGFDNLSSFSRRFSQHFGKCPKELRK